MYIQTCKVYSKGLNYIVWEQSETPKGVFIVHLGGDNKRKLYKMMQELLKEEFIGQEIYFCSQQDTYWRNNSEYDGQYTDGTKVYRYTGKR
jgi:hypothetical protein